MQILIARLPFHFSDFIKLSPTNAYLLNIWFGLPLSTVQDWRHITSSLYKTDTSLRRTVEVGPKGVRLKDV